MGMNTLLFFEKVDIKHDMIVANLNFKEIVIVHALVFVKVQKIFPIKVNFNIQAVNLNVINAINPKIL